MVLKNRSNKIRSNEIRIRQELPVCKSTPWERLCNKWKILQIHDNKSDVCLTIAC